MEVIIGILMVLCVAGWWAMFAWKTVTENCDEDEAERKFFGIYGFALILALIGLGQLL